jgi:hypothetical protein
MPALITNTSLRDLRLANDDEEYEGEEGEEGLAVRRLIQHAVAARDDAARGI